MYFNIQREQYNTKLRGILYYMKFDIRWEQYNANLGGFQNIKHSTM